MNNKTRIIGLGLALAVTAFASAASAQSIAAGCFVSPAKLSDEDIGAFIATPASLIQTDDGVELMSKVRALAGSSASTLDPVIALVAKSTMGQKYTIGSGLGHTAFACRKTDPDYVQMIQQKVATLNDPTVSLAFKQAVGDMKTAALGGAAGLGGGGASISGGASSGGSSGSHGHDDGAAASSASGAFQFDTRASFSRTVSGTASVSPD